MSGTARGPLRVGAASTDITPDTCLVNYAGRLLQRDPSLPGLQAQAVVMELGGLEIALVVCDLLALDRELVQRIRSRCESQIGISGEDLLIAATHTAASPITYAGLVTGPSPDDHYVEFLEHHIADLVEAAREALQPAVLVSGTCPSPGFELNRRSVRPDGSIAFMSWRPDWTVEGPTDPTLSFLGFETPAGDPLALIVTYACHNITQSPFSTSAYSGDFFGWLGTGLRREFPSLLAVPVLSGTQGNVVFGDPTTLEQHSGEAFARRGGQQCATHIAEAYRRSSRTVPRSLGYISRVLELPDRSMEESSFCEDGCRGADPSDLAFARARYEPERQAIAARGPATCHVELTALAIGDSAALVTISGKPFVEHGLEIRSASPFESTLVASLVNGACGYIPTPQAFRNGGYETHRTVHTSRLREDAGDLLVTHSLELLSSLAEESMPHSPEGATLPS